MEQEDFYKLANIVRDERLFKERMQKYNLEKYAQREYYYFTFWCAANNVTESVDAFKLYLEKENKQLPYVVKKWIAENRFGCVQK